MPSIVSNSHSKVNLQFFEKEIIGFFQTSGRVLPWRKNNISPYEVWVSEIMLQQTQVNRVLVYYENFLKAFPSVYDLAKTSWEGFFPYYNGLGYYGRGRNMLTTSQLIVKNYGGIFPKDKKSLKELPGIGDYTASAILSFAYGKNVLAFDTNLKRVFGRFLSGAKNAETDMKALDASLQTEKKVLNAAIMDFANTVCQKKPKCALCCLAPQCRYYYEKGRRETALFYVKNSFPSKEAQVFLWLHKNHKEYYSSNPDAFEVFVLPKEYNTRAKIKEYFEKKYGLILSVRPPHKKVYIESIPTLFVNAQILLGEHEFGVFTKEEMNHALKLQ